MVDLYAIRKQREQAGGFIQNQFRGGQSALAQPLSPTQIFRADSNLGMGSIPEEERFWPVEIAKGIAAAPVDIIDTMATILPGVERGQVNDAVYESIGMPGFADWVRRNQAGVEIGSGIAGAIMVGVAAETAVARLLGAGWFQATGVGQLAGRLTQTVARAEVAAVAATRTAAEAGRTLAWYQGANRTYVMARAGQGVLKASVSEAAILATLHNNSAIWSDDMQSNALFLGLGLGLGGAVGAIGGRAVLNRQANNQMMKDTFADAADPGQYERLMAETPFGVGQAANLSTKRGPIKSAEFTALMLNSKRDDAAMVAPGAKPAATRSSIQTNNERVALQVLQGMTRKGVFGNATSPFNIKATGHGQHIIEAADEDPTILLGATEIGAVPVHKQITDVIDERMQAIDGVLNNRLSTAEDRRLAMMRKQETPLFLMGKRWFGASEVDDLARYSTPTDYKPVSTAANQLEWKAPDSGKKIRLNEDGSMNAKWENLTLPDQLSVVDGMNQMLKRLGPSAKISISATPDWLQLDFALKHAERGGDVDFSAAGFNSLEEIQLASLQKKADIAMGWKAQGRNLDMRARLSLNLPLPTSLEKATDPTGNAFYAILQSSKSGQVNVQTMKALRVSTMKQLDIGSDLNPDARLDGNFFEFNRSKHGKEVGSWMPLVMGTFEDPAKISWSRFDLGDMITEQKALTLKMLTTGNSAPFVQAMSKIITQNPAFRKIWELSGLADSQIGGTKNVVGASASQFLTQAMRFRNNETLLGAQALRRVVNRVTEVHLDGVLKRLTPYTDQLASVAGQRSRVLLNQYISYAPGWDIHKVKQGRQGEWVFELKETERNAARLGRPVVKGETLHSPSGVEVALDDLSNGARVQLEKEYATLLKERNAIRVARGLEPIEHKNFYVPPQSTKDKIIGFTLDSRNRVVPGGTVIAATREQFDVAAARMQAKLTPGQRFMTQEEIMDHADLWEQAQMDFVNPLDFIDPQTLAGPKGAQMGKLAGAAINPRGFDEALDYIKHGYEQTTTGVMRTIFDSQFKISRIRHQASVVTNGQSKFAKDIWQTYDETLLGVSATSNPKGVGILTKKVDETVDEAFRVAWPAGVASVNMLRDVMAKLGVKRLDKVKNFSDLATQLGPHMPFANITEYADYKYGLKAPWKSKGLAATANRIGAGVVLRWLEMPHAIMNMAGIITNLPVVMGAKNVPTVGRVRGVPIPDVARIMAKGFKRQFERGTADWDMMVRNGDTTQDVAELHHQLALLDGKSKFMRFLTGDPSAPDYTQLTGKARSKAFLQAKGLEGMASIITDTSESMSRRWAHFVGLELADFHGITGMEARHNFARQIANDSIANYDPLNRPEIFQSAFGSMYGLFLSYAQNYYQRMFRWVEDGDFKSIGKSLAIQASMFGMVGMPGFRQVAALFGGEEDGDGLVEGIYKRFGPYVGSVVAQGGFNQITTLVGLPAVAFHTRGDVNLRHPALDFAGGVPALPVGLEVLKDIGTGIIDSIGSLVDPKAPNSGRHAAEILARNMPSRALRGAISVMALGGQEADAYGNLMSDTKNAGEVLFRLLGLRSARQQGEIEAYFMDQKAQAIDAERMAPIRAATRALIRDGAYDKLPQVFDKYLDAGGKPWNYPAWVRGLIKEAQNTRGENKLYQALRGPGNEATVNRLRMMTMAYE